MPATRKSIQQLRLEYAAAPDGARLPPAVVAVGLGLSPATLERWRSDGRGPRYSKLAGRITYLKRDAESWANKNDEVLA